MNIHPIKTEADYEQALAEVEQLWGAEEGTENGDKLDVLLVLVEAYEAKHHPIAPPDPIEAIKFRMEQMNLSTENNEGTLRPEYPPELIKSDEHGKYAQHYQESTNIVLIEPELHRLFPDSDAVNQALRQYAEEHRLVVSH